MRVLYYIFFFIVFCGNSLVAQNYYYTLNSKEEEKTIIPNNNRIDWTVAGVEDKIPNYSNIIDVTTRGAESSDIFDNSKILQDLIDSSSFGTVLLFPSGTYLFKSSINLKSGIVIRGVSSSQTVFKFDLNGTAQPSFRFSSWDRSSITPITSGHIKGSRTITVQDPTLFVYRDYIEIFQDNDPELMYTRREWDVTWAAESVGQLVKITSRNGNEITLEHPLLYDFSANLNVRARSCQMLDGAGLESFKLIRLDQGEAFALRFDYAANCWIRNMESEYAQRGHVEMSKSLNIEIRDSYFHHAYDYGGGGHGYGISITDHSTNALIENNIFYYLRHSFLAKEGAIGNVFAYNYSLEPNGNPNDVAMHGHYGLMNLLEGNIVQKIYVGDYWGPSGPGNTFFRNRVETSNIEIQDYSHSQNVVSNEIINGTINISNDTQDTWAINNQNLTGIINEKTNIDTPKSLYLNAKPEFYKTLTWPSIGQEFNLGQFTIPAKYRWDSGTRLVPDLILE